MLVKKFERLNISTPPSLNNASLKLNQLDFDK